MTRERQPATGRRQEDSRPAARPILFSAPMVRALLDGRKTQTRRLMKPQPPKDYRVVWHEGLGAHAGFSRLDENYQPRCPYGVPGDLLWVKETTVIAPPGWTDTPVNPCGPHQQETAYLADNDCIDVARDYGLKKTPSIYMPRWASRLTLQITGIKVERLQDISEEDAEAEGAARLVMDDEGKFYERERGTYRCGYAGLWDYINGPGSWDANPWVVALTFEVHKANVDAVLSARQSAVGNGQWEGTPSADCPLPIAPAAERRT